MFEPSQLDWIPTEFPTNCWIFLTTKKGDKVEEMATLRKWKTFEVKNVSIHNHNHKTTSLKKKLDKLIY